MKKEGEGLLVQLSLHKTLQGKSVKFTDTSNKD